MACTFSPPPLKIWTHGPLFRHERNQLGRYRQHSQLDIEILGEQDPAVDLEIINVAWHLFDRLGISGLSLHLNSTGCPNCKPKYIEKVVAYFNQYAKSLAKNDQRRLQQNPLRILDTKEDATKPFLENVPQFIDHLCPECETHLTKLRTYLEAIDIPYQIDYKLVRGLDYYTKTVFEIKATGSLGSQDTVCGGGRYDGLIEMVGGKPAPGIGFGSGIERIVLTMQAQNIAVPDLAIPSIFIVYLGEAAKTEALKITNQLRQKGHNTDFAPGDRSLKAQLKSANRNNAHYALILGTDELAEGIATIRNLQTKDQHKVQLTQVVDWFQNNKGTG